MLSIIRIIKTSDVKMIRMKLIALYMLNVLDALLTHIMMSTGHFYEMNVLLAEIVINTAAFLGLKIFVPGVLVFLLCIRISSATERQLRLGNIPVNISLFLYILVDLNHALWMIYLIIALPI